MARLLSILVMLGPVEFRSHPILAALILCLRHVILMGLAIVLLFLAYGAFAPKTPSSEEIEKTTAETTEALARLTEPLSEQKVVPSDVQLSVVTNDSSGTFFTLLVACGPCESTPEPLPLFEVRPLMGQSIWTWMPDGWRIKEVKYSNGPFVISALLIEAARLDRGYMDANEDLTASDVEQLRARIDGVLGQLPSPSDTTYAMARRLVGPIQGLSWVLFGYGVLLVVFTYVSTVVPNMLMRVRNSTRADGMVALMKQDAVSILAWEGETAGEAQALEDITTPWSSTGQIVGSPSLFERFYATIGDDLRQKLGLFGGRPVLPLTELRRVGYMAMQSSPRGENVPGFVAVEADGMAETLEARNKLVQFLIWAIPTVGFVGTVLGIGDALSGTADIQSSVLSTRVSAESEVSSSIGLAFDTTFVALVLSFVLMLLFYLLQAAQDGMIAREKRTALEEIIQPNNIPVNTPIQDLSGVERSLMALNRKIDAIDSTETRPVALTPPADRPEKTTSNAVVFWILVVLLGVLLAAMVNRWQDLSQFFQTLWGA